VDRPSGHVRIISEEIDKMQADMETALKKSTEGDGIRNNSVKLIRSRRETRIVFVLKGGLEETENTLQKIYKAVTS
jgi:hypothetical protein